MNGHELIIEFLNIDSDARDEGFPGAGLVSGKPY